MRVGEGIAANAKLTNSKVGSHKMGLYIQISGLEKIANAEFKFRARKLASAKIKIREGMTSRPMSWDYHVTHILPRPTS